MKKVCFLAQFPPPIHGLSKAVDTLYNSYLKDENEFKKIDITDNKKFLYNIFKLVITKADLYYFTISQTKGGNLRDLIILKLISMKKGKCLIHLHGGYYRKLVDSLGNFQKKLNFKYIGKLEGAIVLGNSLRCIFNDMIDDNKIFVVPNCVDNEFLMSDETFNKKLSDFDKNNINVLYLSNFIKEKGYRQVLELAKYTRDINDNRFVFNFAGNFFDENEKKYFEDYIKDNSLSDRINYLGVVKGKEKIELLEKSNVFMLLTRYPNEGQPISILEAMGNGIVVVTTDHAGIPDIVKDNVNGVMLKNYSESDIEYLYKKTIDIIDNNYKTVIENNRKEVLNNYTEEKYLENFGKLFRNL
jgi:glycosyltransferase, family 1